MPIIVEIQCDFQHPRAIGARSCASRRNRNPVGKAEKIVFAHRNARQLAALGGWTWRTTYHAGRPTRVKGWACPTCSEFEEEDGHK
jgi:hypothetical protein